MSKQKREQAVREQMRWIEHCGGTLSGYRLRYGDCDLPICLGDGATAIYSADLAELRRLCEVTKRSY